MSDSDALTHINAKGEAHMVNVANKAVTHRSATARAYVAMQASTLAMIDSDQHKKGDVYAVARIAGIQATKKCGDLIPLCHPLNLTHVTLDIRSDVDTSRVEIHCTCELDAKTGVEMEALTGASIAALTIYDMCKAVDKGMIIGPTQLIKKTGGKSGDWFLED